MYWLASQISRHIFQTGRLTVTHGSLRNCSDTLLLLHWSRILITQADDRILLTFVVVPFSQPDKRFLMLAFLRSWHWSVDPLCAEKVLFLINVVAIILWAATKWVLPLDIFRSFHPPSLSFTVLAVHNILETLGSRYRLQNLSTPLHRLEINRTNSQ